MKNTSSGWALFFLAALSAGAFFLPFWPFAALAAALAPALRHPVLGLCIGLCFDLLWGAPGGWLGAPLFPLTALAVLSFGIRMAADRYFFHRVSVKTLY